MQRLLGVDEPDFGHLLDDFFYARARADPDATGSSSRGSSPRSAFVLKAPLAGSGRHGRTRRSPPSTSCSRRWRSSTAGSRDWKIGLLDTIADNASSGAVVLGSTPTAARRRSTCASPGASSPATARSSAPAPAAPSSARRSTSLVWLANTVGARGVTLEAGHVVLPGAVCAMVPVAPGDTVTATFAGLGSVTARFDGPRGRHRT